jgi:hypothetical protein
MKNLLRILANILSRPQPRSIEERYLAQAVDAKDLEARMQTLERARH